MRKAPGFMIIDLLLGMVIAGFVISMAMNFPVTLVSVWRRLSLKVNKDVDLCKILGQLDKDFSTIYLPILHAEESPIEKEGEEEKSGAEVREKEAKVEKRYFSVVRESEKLDYVFFVNTNPMDVYSKSKPKIAGVAYRLEQKLEEKDVVQEGESAALYDLYRYETPFLFLNGEEPIKFEEIAEYKTLVLSNVDKFDLRFRFIKPLEKKTQPALPVPSQDEPKQEDAEGEAWPVEGVSQEFLPYKFVIKCSFFHGKDKQEFEKEVWVFSSHQFEKKNQKSSMATTPGKPEVAAEKSEVAQGGPTRPLLPFPTSPPASTAPKPTGGKL